MNKKLSIRDIAEELQVAKSTVSFILNGKAKEKKIGDKLVEKVLKFVEEKGFRPNHLARSLSTGKSKIICLMVEKMSDYFFSQIAFHLEELAYKNGYQIIYCSTENDPKRTRELFVPLRARHVDGYIIMPPAGVEPEITALINENIPVVTFDRRLPLISTDYVGWDNFQGTFDATEFLIKSQVKKIAFISVTSGQTLMAEKQSGYLAAVKKYAIKPVIFELFFEFDSEIIVKRLIRFIESHQDLEGIVFADSYLTLCGIKAINKLGLDIPGDISIISFDDHEVFNICNPSISAVSSPLDKLAISLFETLLDKLENKNGLQDFTQTIIRPELILRGSTRKPIVS